MHPSITSAIDASRGGGRPLERTTRELLEPGLGESLGDVRVHADAHAEALARAVSARAFTVGSDLFFAAGAYRPGSRDGDKLIAHEVTHAVQQRGAPTSGPVSVSAPGDAAELEAEATSATMQKKASAHPDRESASPAGHEPARAAGATQVTRGTAISIARTIDFSDPYQAGYADGQAGNPSAPPSPLSSEAVDAYNQGYQDGQAQAGAAQPTPAPASAASGSTAAPVPASSQTDQSAALAGMFSPGSAGPVPDITPGGFPPAGGTGPFPRMPIETPLTFTPSTGAAPEVVTGAAPEIVTGAAPEVLTVGTQTLGDAVLADTAVLADAALTQGAAITGTVIAEGAPAVLGAATLAGGADVVAVTGTTAALAVAGTSAAVPIVGWVLAVVIVAGVVLILATQDPPAQLPGSPGEPVSEPATPDQAEAPGVAGPSAEAPGLSDQEAVAPGPAVDDPDQCAWLNKAGTRHQHHIFPQQFREYFKAIGIDIDSFCVDVDPQEHIGKGGIHTIFDYNGQWEDFFNDLDGQWSAEGGYSLEQPPSDEEAAIAREKAQELAAEILNDAGMADLFLHICGSKLPAPKL